jgi:glycosyltransferase involved in cell wall biosynthesis
MHATVEFTDLIRTGNEEQMPPKPLVSILINNYNYAQFLGHAIDSSLGQTYNNVEVVVVDDGSTDNSREVIERYSGRVLPVLKENGGQSTAFNAAFAASSGEIVCPLDADDYFLPNKVEKIVECYLTHPAADYVFHPLKRVGINGVDVEAVAKTENVRWETVERSRWLDYRHRRNTFAAPPTTGLTMRRSLWDALKTIPHEVPPLADNYVKFVVMGLSRGYYLAEQLGVLTLHGNNLFSMGGNDVSRLPVDMRIASAIRRNFPELLSVADRFAAITLEKAWRLQGALDLHETSRALEAYLDDASWRSAMQIYAGAFLRLCKQSVIRASKHAA